MSRTTDALKYLFGRTGSYVDEKGVKKPLPYDKKFLKKFFKSRLIDRLIKEGTKAFDTGRFAVVPDYIDTLHIIYNHDGTIKSAQVITNIGDVIDCTIEVKTYLSMLYVTTGAKATDSGEWLSNNPTAIVYYDKRSSYTGSATWVADRSVSEAGLEATAYYYHDGVTTGFCCESVDGQAGTFKLAKQMLYHLFDGVKTEAIQGFANAVNYMLWDNDVAYMNGTFTNLVDADTDTVYLDLDWMINKWHNAGINFSTADNKPLNVIWPNNLQGIDTTDAGYTIWINGTLTTESWTRLANNIATHGDADTWKATIKVETTEQSVNLPDDVKAQIELKGWVVSIPEPKPVEWYVKATLDYDTNKFIALSAYGDNIVAYTNDGYYYYSSNNTEWSRSAEQLHTESGEYLSDIGQIAVAQTGDVFFFPNITDNAFDYYYWGSIRDYADGSTFVVTKQTMQSGDVFYNPKVVSSNIGVLAYSEIIGEHRMVKVSQSYLIDNIDGGVLVGDESGVLGVDSGRLYSDFSGSGEYTYTSDLKITGNPNALWTERELWTTTYVAIEKGVVGYNQNTQTVTTVFTEDLTGSKIDALVSVNEKHYIVASAGKVLHSTNKWTGTFEDTGLTYKNRIEFWSKRNNTFAIADGVLYVKQI